MSSMGRLSKTPRVRGVRRYPATTGMSATGRCGHPYRTRLSIPDLFDKVRTADLEAELARVISTQQTVLLERPCPQCASEHTLQQAATAEDQLAAIYELPALPPLPGSVRQQAAGRAVRAQFLFSVAEAASSGLYWELRSFGYQFLLEAITQRWGKPAVATSDEVRLRVSQMLHCLRTRGADDLPRSSEGVSDRQVVEGLAAWLIGRFQINSHPTLDQQRSASEWLLLSKLPAYRETLSPQPVPPRVAMAAILVAQYGGWQSPNGAWSAFGTLIGNTSPLSMNILDDRASAGGHSMADVLSDISTMEALNGLAGDPFDVGATTPF